VETLYDYTAAALDPTDRDAVSTPEEMADLFTYEQHKHVEVPALLEIIHEEVRMMSASVRSGYFRS
jgi:hypothetical protein